MLTSEKINELKAKVKTEMARRSGNGSLANFAGSAYDFSDVPAPGKLILAEHGQKTINPLLNIKDVPGLVLVADTAPDGSTPSGQGDDTDAYTWRLVFSEGHRKIYRLAL